ncbi:MULTISPECIES: hypothetical protein [unclassified Kosakonia]
MAISYINRPLTEAAAVLMSLQNIVILDRHVIVLAALSLES